MIKNPRMIAATRPSSARNVVNLAKRRQWYANEVAYGLENLVSVFAERVTEIGIDTVNEAIIESTAEHNRISDGMLDLMASQTTASEIQFKLPNAGTLQPVDPDGVPFPTRPSGVYTVGFPLHRGADAWGGNTEALALMTLEEVNRKLLDTQRMDATWRHDRVLAAALTKDTYNYDDDVLDRDVVVTPLANGDSVIYVRRGAVGPATTDNHYLGQAAAIADGADDPFQAIYDDLAEHPSFIGPVVCYSAQNQVAAIRGLANFTSTERMNFIQRGEDTATLSEQIEDMLLFGTRVEGEHEAGVIIVRVDSMPAGYLLNVDLGAGAFLRRRVRPVAQLQGLQAEPQFNIDGVHLFNQFRRIEGYGCQNRVAALAYEIGNASYTNPTDFTAPLFG